MELSFTLKGIIKLIFIILLLELLPNQNLNGKRQYGSLLHLWIWDLWSSLSLGLIPMEYGPYVFWLPQESTLRPSETTHRLEGWVALRPGDFVICRFQYLQEFLEWNLHDNTGHL